MIDIKPTGKTNLGPNITPLVDIVFLLLIFFMLTAFFIKPEGIDISLPRAEGAPAAVDNEIVITIEADGSVHMSGKAVGLDEISDMIERELSGNPARPVVLRADRNIPLERAVQVMERAKAGGAESVIVATENPGP